jgi:REP-associated tyrosine transposase
MGHTFSQIFVHVVFSTKGRAPFINAELRDDLLGYLAGIARKLGAQLVKGGASDDHVHLLLLTKPAQALSDTLKTLKANSSRWMHETHAEVRGFAWQSGYSGFSVSASAVPAVKRYIEDQETHHHRMTFEDELRLLLQKHNVAFDPDHYLD